MNKINYRRVLLGGFIAGIVQIAVEVIVEVLILGNIPGIGIERERLSSLSISKEAWSSFNHIIQLLIPFLASFLMVWVYTAIRPRFGPGPRTALIASAIFLCNWLILLIYFTNIGIFTLKVSIASFVDNLLVIPVALLAGAKVYRENREAN